MAMSTSEFIDEQSLGAIAEKLSSQERQLLNLIGDVGAVAPAEIAVKTLTLPEEADQLLNDLGQKGLIRTQLVESSSSPQLVTLTDLGSRVARFEVLKRMR